MLRKAIKNVDILILGYTPNYLCDDLIKDTITPTVFTWEQAEHFSMRAMTLDKIFKIHIKIDTGMNGLGFKTNLEAIQAIKKISDLPNLNIEGIFTHFASAHEADKTYALKQHARFIEFVENIEKEGIMIPIKHVSNSATILDLPNLHLDLVRPAVLLFGLYPSDEVKKERIDIKETLSIRAEVISIKELEVGEGVSYGLTYIANKKSQIAVIPIGYGDLFIKNLSNKGSVIVNGEKAPIVGSVCMDQMMIDVTGLNVKIGDLVTIIGDSGDRFISANRVAEQISIPPYILICSVNKRLPRIYNKNGKIIKEQDLNIIISNDL